VTGLLFKLEELEALPRNLYILSKRKVSPATVFLTLFDEEVAPKPSLNGDYITDYKRRGIYVVAVFVVICRLSVESSRKGVSRWERR